MGILREIAKKNFAGMDKRADRSKSEPAKIAKQGVQ
jgi:hypothetical protein